MANEEFKESIPIRIGEYPYMVKLEKGNSGANYISIQRDDGKNWNNCTTKDIFELIVDGLKFRDLKRAEKIKEELSK